MFCEKQRMMWVKGEPSEALSYGSLGGASVCMWSWVPGKTWKMFSWKFSWFWTACQVTRRCQQSLCISECFMNYFMRMKLAISIGYLSGSLKLEGFWFYFFVMEIMQNSVLMFLVITVEWGSKNCKTIQEVESENRFFSSGVLGDHLKEPWS